MMIFSIPDPGSKEVGEKKLVVSTFLQPTILQNRIILFFTDTENCFAN
jgi:hypothetical protein